MDPGRYQSIRGNQRGWGGPMRAGSARTMSNSTPQEQPDSGERKSPRQPDQAEGEREDALPRSRDQKGDVREDPPAPVSYEEKRGDRETM